MPYDLMHITKFRIGAYASSLLGITTIALFLYVMLVPWLTGEEHNVRHSGASRILHLFTFIAVPIVEGIRNPVIGDTSMFFLPFRLDFSNVV